MAYIGLTCLLPTGLDRNFTPLQLYIEDGSEGGLAAYFCPLLHTPAICKAFRG